MRATKAQAAWLTASLLLFGTGAAASAQSGQAAAAAPDPALHAKAIQLAHVVQPRDRAVAQAMEQAERAFIPALLRDPNIGRLETEHPGILAAVWKAAAPALRDMLVQRLPELWERLAAVYERHLTARQLDQITAFYLSPLAQKFMSSLNAQANLAPMAADALRSPSADIGEGSYLETVRDAATGAAANLTPQEQVELVRFMSTPAGAAMNAAAPEIARSGVEWMNKDDPVLQKRIDEAMMTAAQAFIAAEAKAPKRK